MYQILKIDEGGFTLTELKFYMYFLSHFMLKNLEISPKDITVFVVRLYFERNFMYDLVSKVEVLYLIILK